MLHKIAKATRFVKDNGLSGIASFLKARYSLPLPLSNRWIWKNSINSEVKFWDSYFRDEGGQWYAGYKRRLDPDLPLQPRPASLLPNATDIRILDVGAGPLTYLGKVAQGKTLHIHAVDALADKYDEILHKYGIDPLVRTEKVDAESLATRFSPNSFDLVFARNCIDHAYSPERAIKEMLTVTKKGCYVLMEHHPNEAKKQGYTGLHQWNFAMSDSGAFLIASSHSTVNITETLREWCDVDCELTTDVGENWLITRFRKK